MAKVTVALVVACVSVGLLATGCTGDGEATDPDGGIPAAPAEHRQFGYITALERDDSGWVMRFNPAWLLVGETANVAAAEDGVVAEGEPVPNDGYVVDETDRLYTYRVADDAEVEVLTRSGDQVGTTTITVSGLADVLEGTSSLTLFEPLDTGVWLTIEIDTVTGIVHQYKP